LCSPPAARCGGRSSRAATHGASSSATTGASGIGAAAKRPRGCPLGSRDKKPRKKRGDQLPEWKKWGDQPPEQNPPPPRLAAIKPEGDCAVRFADLLVMLDASDWCNRLRLPASFARECASEMPGGVAFYHTSGADAGTSMPNCKARTSSSSPSAGGDSSARTPSHAGSSYAFATAVGGTSG
jgi:hypothetical protein